MPNAIRGIGRQRVAALGLAALVASLTPIAIHRSGAVESPFLFASAWHIAGGIAALAYLGVRYRPLFTTPVFNEFLRPRDGYFRSRGEKHYRVGVARLIPSMTAAVVIAAIIFGHSDLLFLVWSIRLTDVAVATILYEIWPFVVYASGVLPFVTDRGLNESDDSDGRNTVTERVVEISILFAGLGFVVASPFGAISSVIGMFFGVMSSIAWGTQYALISTWVSGRSIDRCAGIAREDIELFGMLLISSIVMLATGLGFFVVALVNSEPVSESIAVAVAASVTVTLIVRPVIRRAASEVPQTWSEAILLVIPFAAFMWLLLFSRVHVQYLDRLLIGAVAVLAATVLINFRAERRLGFRSLLIGVWGFGTFVYFRPELAEMVSVGDWSWDGDEYFTAIGLSATIFTLILSFRIQRIMSRSSDEATLAVSLRNRVESLVSRGVVSGSVRGHVLSVDAHKDQEHLRAAYQAARDMLAESYGAPQNQADRPDITLALTELDTLAYSRQAGRDFGEFVALSVFAAITVSLALFSFEDAATCWGGVLIEMFTVLFCAVVVFLIINVWDLQAERGMAVLDPHGRGISFRDSPRTFQQKISVGIVVVMMITYGWLLTDKWLVQPLGC